MIRALVAGLLAVLPASPAAAPERTCVTLQRALEVMGGAEHFLKPHQLVGMELAVAVEVYNTLPPMSDKSYDTGMLVADDAGGGTIFLGNAGMICVWVSVEPEDWFKIRSLIDGWPV